MKKHMIWSVAVMVVAGSVASAWGQAAEPIREGDGTRRTELSRRELKPFDATAWSKLTDWKNGAPISSADTSGKVVCILTWSDFHPASKRAFASASRLAERFGKDGLLVVAAHKAEGWDAASKLPVDKNPALRLAHDEKDAFRAALMSDSDPDFYLIDRAGQLRFADVTTDSVEGGVQLLLAEKADEAAKVNERIAANLAKADAESRRTLAARSQVDFTKLPVLPFEKPSAEAYKSAAWPKTPRDTQNTQGNSVNIKRHDPRPVTLPKEDWYPRTPNHEGKATLVYFWHPDILWSYQEAVRAADALQNQYARDVNVVGLLVIPESVGGTDLKDEQKDPEKLKARLKKFAAERTYEHFITFDNNRAIFTAIATENPLPAPFFIVISSDGQARWWTSSTDGSDPRGALLTVIENDPGIAARRRAEDEYLKSKGG